MSLKYAMTEMAKTSIAMIPYISTCLPWPDAHRREDLPAPPDVVVRPMDRLARVGDSLALTVEILEDAHAEFFRVQQRSASPRECDLRSDPVARWSATCGRAEIGSWGVHVVQLRASEKLGAIRRRIRRLSRQSALALESLHLGFVVSKLGQERGLDRGVLQGTRLEVHAPDQRLSLRDVRLDEPDALGLGVCDGGAGASVGVSRAGVEDETTEGRVFVRARVWVAGDAPPSRLGKEAVLRAMEAVNSRNSFS